MSDKTVYVIGKEPMTQHPQKCRIEICDKIPTPPKGWILYSSITTVDAEEIYSSVTEILNEIHETNYDPAECSWMIPIVVLNKWMISRSELIRISSSENHDVKFFKYL
jgi:hypothetical protein